MRIHCVSYYDEPDCLELIDIDYQCSYMCMIETLMREVSFIPETEAGQANFKDEAGEHSISWGGCPGSAETNYDVYCSGCRILLWEGLSED